MRVKTQTGVLFVFKHRLKRERFIFIGMTECHLRFFSLLAAEAPLCNCVH